MVPHDRAADGRTRGHPRGPADRAPAARAQVKRMLHEYYQPIDYPTMFAALAESPEPREGMRAFMEKRQPAWFPPDLPS